MIDVRLATTQDAAAIRAIYSVYVQSTPITFENDVPSIEETRESIANRLTRFPWLVAELDNDVVGYAYACEHRLRAAYRWSVDTSIYIAASAHRRGVGRVLYGQLLPILKRQQFRMAHAGITLPNEASVGLHESFGFQQVATYPNVGHKAGEWRDVGWWSLDLQPELANAKIQSDPEEPTPFCDLANE